MTTTGYTLTGITNGRSTCDHCNRELSRLFRVTSPEGTQMVLGRKCAANVTGHSWSLAQAERFEQVRIADEAAADRYGSLYVTLKSRAADRSNLPAASAAASGHIALRDMRGLSEPEALAFAQQMLAVSGGAA